MEAEDGTSLGIEQFLTLLVHLAFFRENPRYTPALPGAPKLTQETVPVVQCVTSLLNDFLPKMKKGEQNEFRMVRARGAPPPSLLAGAGPSARSLPPGSSARPAAPDCRPRAAALVSCS